jgi:ribosome-binding protein aMBF1 (putative translation factor)
MKERRLNCTICKLHFEVFFRRVSSSPAITFEARLIEILLMCRRCGVNRISINEGVVLVTTRQIKAARALLAWSQADLADRSGISEPTVARLEAADGELGGREDTTQKLRAAIEAAGVEFIDENGGGLGVRLRKSRTEK